MGGKGLGEELSNAFIVGDAGICDQGFLNMKQAAFTKKVLQKLPGFSQTDGYFYTGPINHVLSGFVCEFSRSGIYILRYTYPLFIKGPINLNFAERLPYPEGYIDFDMVDKAKVVDEFLERVQPLLQDSKAFITTVEGLEQYVASRDGTLENPTIRRVYAYINIILDRFSEASMQIDTLLNLLEPLADDQPLPIDFSLEELYCFKNLLTDDPEKAKQQLLEWEHQNKQEKGIVST